MDNSGARRIRLSGWLLGLLFTAVSSGATNEFSEDALKAAYLYRFAGYVEWPSTVENSAVFTIAVFGPSGVTAELERLLATQPVKNRPARVRRIGALADLDRDAHMLYVGSGQSPSALRRIIAATGKRPVLVVTDDARGLEFGGAINFVQQARRIRFEVSLPAARNSGLAISSELLAVAWRVQSTSRDANDACIEQSIDGHRTHCPPKEVRQ